MIYKWKTGSRISFSAQVAGEICSELAERDALTAENLVDVSRPKEAPLHRAFEWDDAVAGEEWRKHQARHIISSVVVRAETKEPVRAFFNIRSEGPYYRPLNVIMQNENMTVKLLDEALCDLRALRAKYGTLERLRLVMTAIDDTLDTCEEATP